MMRNLWHDTKASILSKTGTDAQTNGNLKGLTEYFEQEQTAFFEETKDMVLPYDIIKEKS